MVAGADSIDDMALLPHAGMARLFTGVRAPSTLGTFLAFVHLRPCPSAQRGGLPVADRPGTAGPLLPGADQLACLDIDDTVRRTYGHAKQGALRGYTGVQGLNALLAVISTRPSRR